MQNLLPSTMPDGLFGKSPQANKGLSLTVLDTEYCCSYHLHEYVNGKAYANILLGGRSLQLEIF